MYSYYGSKQKIIKKYPKPICDTIIDAFCGSARYPLLHFEKNVILYDVYKPVYEVWSYLIKEATPKMILDLPDVPNATVLESIQGFSQLSKAEKWLIGFCSNGGSAQPKNVSGRHNFNSWNRDKFRIAKDLYKIKHWNIFLESYVEIPDYNVTWFIDPPYQDKGKWYPKHDIDYAALGDWCRNRKGQVIVCENMGADWLPFTPLVEVPFTHFKTQEDKKKRTVEGIYYHETSLGEENEQRTARGKVRIPEK